MTSGTPQWTHRLGRRLSWRAACGALACGLVLVAVAWIVVHEVPGAGPWAADNLRACLGPDRVARLEDAAYGLRDSVNRVVLADEPPKSYWQVPQPALSSPRAKPEAREDGSGLEDDEQFGSQPEIPAWTVAPVHPPFFEVAAPGDGTWVPVAASDPAPGEQPGPVWMKKTLLHPDPARTWAELFVVAVDARETELHWVPGTAEPTNVAPGAHELRRFGRIPIPADTELLAAFNGGFKTVHGRFGAASAGITLVPPKRGACTIVRRADGELTIGSWEQLEPKESFQWLRQTPPCMVEEGELHPGLARTDNTNWGATLGGQTVIRRSALGLSEDGRTLLVGISNDTTARALALGMRQAGAHTVAQLDVNYAYPKFVLFEDNAADGAQGVAGNAPSRRPKPRSLVDGFVVSEHQYQESESRDFFYLTRRLERRASGQGSRPDAG